METETPDLCPTCCSFGMAPCYGPNGEDVSDHDGRPVAHANAGNY